MSNPVAMDPKEKEAIQWDNWLLEAVRKIRTQKQRPGLDRIYNAVRLLAEKQELAEHSQKSPIAPIYHVQFNQIKIEQVQRHLDRAVRKGLLLKVYSKGQATYKAVEKSERTLNLSIGQDAPGELSKCILKVIREISECDAPVPTSSSVTVSSLSGNKPPKVGYTFDTIEEYVRHSHVIIYPDDVCPQDFLPNLVRQALQKECSRGKLELVNGEYYRLPAQTPTSQGSLSGASGAASKPKLSSVSTASSSSNNSNSSWTSSSSTTPTTPTTFAGISSTVSGKNTAGASPGSAIKKDNGGPATKAKLKEGSPVSSSPPRGNLPGDLSEAEEIALVTEQTARAVKLVMKDRRPGEKPPVQKKSVVIPSAAPAVPSATSQDSSTQEPVKKPGVVSSSGANSNSSNGGSGSSDEEAARKSPPIDASLKDNEGSSSSATSGVTQQKTDGNGNNGNKAVIKLLVPTFPARNGNGSNGNGNGNGGGNKNPNDNPTKPSSPPPQGKGVSPPPQHDQNPKLGVSDTTLATQSQSNTFHWPPATGSTQIASTSSAHSLEVTTNISNITSGIMNQWKSERIEAKAIKTKKGICLICCERVDASPGIVKDLSYSTMIQLYFTSIGVDVKPEVCAQVDVCPACFCQLEKFQEAHDVLIFFESFAEHLRIDLLKSVLDRKGNANDEKILWIYKEVRRLHGDTPESRERLQAREEQAKLTMDQYNFQVYEKDSKRIKKGD